MRKALLVLATAVMATAAAPAIASGSGSSGGGRKFSGSDFQESPEQRLERRGKSQVRKRITCKKCEYHKRLNQQTAAQVAQGVREGKFDLKDRDRQAVLYFLRARYGV